MMTTPSVRFYREKLNFTQSELAERASVSLRTIQRLESGIVPKGHTLEAVAKALEIDKNLIQEQIQNGVSEGLLKAKMINLAALSFIIIPFGNLILPFLLWQKNRKYQLADHVGRKLINIQILWSLITSMLLITLPFVQKILFTELPLIVIGLIFAFCVNITIILRNTHMLNQNQFEKVKVPVLFL